MISDYFTFAFHMPILFLISPQPNNHDEKNGDKGTCRKIVLTNDLRKHHIFG